MNLKTILMAAMACTVLLCLNGCDKPGNPQNIKTEKVAPGTKIKLGFIVKMPDESWFQHEWKFADKCAKKYGFDLVELSGKTSDEVLNDIDTLASQGAQGFVICTPDPRLGPAIMQKANSLNLKVFTVDDQLVDGNGKFMEVPYMGISSRAIGTSVGEALAAEYKKRGWKQNETAALAVTFDELNTVKERTDGAKDALVKSGFAADKIYNAPERTTNLEASLDAANNVITQHPDVKHWLVYSVNDEGVLGAVHALATRGFGADNVIGIGIGGMTALNEFRQAKPTGMWGTIVISEMRHGYETTEMLYKWVKDGTVPPKDTRTTGILATRDTCEKIMRDQELID